MMVLANNQTSVMQLADSARKMQSSSAATTGFTLPPPPPPSIALCSECKASSKPAVSPQNQE